MTSKDERINGIIEDAIKTSVAAYPEIVLSKKQIEKIDDDYKLIVMYLDIQNFDIKEAFVTEVQKQLIQNAKKNNMNIVFKEIKKFNTTDDGYQNGYMKRWRGTPYGGHPYNDKDGCRFVMNFADIQKKQCNIL